MRHAFSLLEILLALAILGGSLAVLSQIAGTGIDAAREARDLVLARVICQSKLSEAMLTGTTPQAVVSTPVEDVDSQSLTPFFYSIEVVPGQLEGLLAIRVEVQAMNPDTNTPLVTYSLVRWMIDPALGLEEAEAAEKAEAEALAETATSAGGV